MTHPGADRPATTLRLFLFAAGLLLTAILVGTRVEWVLQQEFPRDYDGFYYLQEFKSRLDGGSGYYHHLHPFFTVWTGIGSLFGLSPEALLCAVVVCSYGIFLAALLSGAAGSSFWWLAPLLTSAAARSDGLFYLCYGFPRQAFGSSIAAFGIVLLARGASRRTGWLFLLCAPLFHLFAAALALGMLIASAVFAPWKRAAVPLALTGIVAAAGLPLTGKELAGDLIFGAAFPWDTAASFGWLSLEEQWEYPVMFVSSLALIPFAWKTRAPVPLVLLALTTLLMAPIWRVDGGGPFFRFLISSTIPWYLGIATLTSGSGSARLKGGIDTALASACLLFVVLAPPPFSSRRPVGPRFDPRLLRDNAEALKRLLPADARIVAPHGIQFQITYFTGFPASKAGNTSDVYPLYRFTPQVPPGKECISPDALPSGLPPECIALGAPTDTWYFDLSRPGTR